MTQCAPEPAHKLNNNMAVAEIAGTEGNDRRSFE